MTHINQRRDTAANWTSANPVLQLGEVGWETDTRKSKLGDGVTAWVDLDYTIADVVVTAADIGLGAVDNTSDADKPISDATQAALDLKADAAATTAAINAKVIDSIADADTTHAPSRNAVFDALALKAPLASPAFTGNPTAPTPATGDDDTSVATTEFVHDTLDAIPAPDVQIFTSGGTWNKPAGAKYVEIEVLGAGGAGGGSGPASASQNSRGSGGGAGGYAYAKKVAADLTASVAVTVGTGGASAAAANGGAGGGSSFGAYVVAGGGSGGNYLASNGVDFWVAGGAGGSATAGDLLVPGRSGNPSNGNGVLGMGARGADSRYGAGGQEATSGTANQIFSGNAGTGYGSGGGGSLQTAVTAVNRGGGAGAPGLVIVRTYFA